MGVCVAISAVVRSDDDAKGTVIVTDANIAGRIIDLQPSKEIKKQPDLNEVFGSAPPPQS